MSFAWPLTTEHSPAEVLRVFRHRRRLVGLLGAWAGGGAVIGFDPIAHANDTFVLDAEAPTGTNDLEPASVRPPRIGGAWLGVIGYQWSHTIERLPAPPPRPRPRPRCDLAYYDTLLRYEGRTGSWWFESRCAADQVESARRRFASVQRCLRRAAPRALRARPFTAGPFQPTPALDVHADAVRRAIAHIAAGDIFQANVCLRLDATFDGDPLDAFLAGVERLSPAYAAFVRGEDGAVASLSPELFLRRAGRRVLTAPIKGTAPLGTDPRVLGSSAKDRAENVMIVDLMRNDLGRVSVPGSVAVPEMLAAQRHTGVWHLVSEVQAELRAGVTDQQLLRATFPPGSVTGAPKVRAMEVINDLERTAREAYTGAIGWSGAAGMELNVAIRTFEFAPGEVWLGVGGGVVADSDPAQEVAECLVKARPLLAAIGTGFADEAAQPVHPSSGEPDCAT